MHHQLGGAFLHYAAFRTSSDFPTRSMWCEDNTTLGHAHMRLTLVWLQRTTGILAWVPTAVAILRILTQLVGLIRRV